MYEILQDGIYLVNKIRHNRLATKVTSYRLDDWGSTPDNSKNFSLHHHTEISSGSHPFSYPVGSGIKGATE
jgi:hypothetical protein